MAASRQASRRSRDAALNSSLRTASTSMCRPSGPRKFLAKYSIVDKYVLFASPRQLVTIILSGQENLIQENFCSVPREYKVWLLAMVCGVAADTQRELQVLPLVAAKGKNSRL